MTLGDKFISNRRNQSDAVLPNPFLSDAPILPGDNMFFVLQPQLFNVCVNSVQFNCVLFVICSPNHAIQAKLNTSTEYSVV